MLSKNHNNVERIQPIQLPGPDTTTKQDAIMSTDPRLQAMLKEAARIGWPNCFQNDLYLHDRAILLDRPGEPLVWILRDHGTHLLPVECESNGQAEYARAVIHYWSGDDRLNVITNVDERPRFYLVSDSGLIESTATEAASLIRLAAAE